MSLDKLSEFRSEIDKLDDEIITLLKARMNIAAQIADYKNQNNIPTLNSNREDEILKKVSDKSGEVLSLYIAEIYKEIMKESREYQNNINKKASTNK